MSLASRSDRTAPRIGRRNHGEAHAHEAPSRGSRIGRHGHAAAPPHLGGVPAAEASTATPPERAGIQLGRDVLHRNRLSLSLALLLALVSTGATLAVPLLVKAIIDAFTSHHAVNTPMVWLATVATAAALFSAASGYLLARLGEFTILRLRRRVMDHTLRLPLLTVRSQGTGNLVARITSDALLFRSVIDVGVIQLPLALLTVLFSLIVMAVIDWVLVLITICSFAIAGLAIALVLTRVKKNVLEQQEVLGALAQRFTAYVTSLATIKAYRAEERSSVSLGTDAASMTKAALIGARLQSLIAPIMGLGQQLALVSVIVGGGMRIAHGHLSVPAFAAFLLYLLQLVSPVTVVATGMSRLQAGLAARARFDDLLTLPQEIAGPEPDTLTDAPGAQPCDSAAAVEFRDVTFGYSDTPVLRRLTLSAPRAGLTALVGPSGAGKTTVLALTDRFFHADSGLIRILGRDINDWPLEELRHRITYVDQQFTLVEGTVRENLELGRALPATEAELLTALDAVGIKADIQDLPESVDTRLGRDNDLSGGQRQRLALARVLLTDADIVLLDEPTSQLDSVNERRFRQVVDEMATTRAIVLVAHRLTTVLHADQVMMMERGELVDAGTHTELMDRCPAYHNLFASQGIAPNSGQRCD